MAAKGKVVSLIHAANLKQQGRQSRQQSSQELRTAWIHRVANDPSDSKQLPCQSHSPWLRIQNKRLSGGKILYIQRTHHRNCAGNWLASRETRMVCPKNTHGASLQKRGRFGTISAHSIPCQWIALSTKRHTEIELTACYKVQGHV